MNVDIIPGFENFTEILENICNSESWKKCQDDFNNSDRIFTVGNGGNLAVCDHGAIDIARLSNKESVFGDLLDSVIDRYGEAAIFLSLACYYLFNSLDEIAVLLCIISMLCSQLISYVRAKSESLDIENKSGFLTRVERSLIIIFFLLISQPLFALYILSVGTFFSSIWRLIIGLKNAKN